MPRGRTMAPSLGFLEECDCMVEPRMVMTSKEYELDEEEPIKHHVQQIGDISRDSGKGEHADDLVSGHPSCVSKGSSYMEGSITEMQASEAATTACGITIIVTDSDSENVCSDGDEPSEQAPRQGDSIEVEGQCEELTGEFVGSEICVKENFEYDSVNGSENIDSVELCRNETELQKIGIAEETHDGTDLVTMGEYFQSDDIAEEGRKDGAIGCNKISDGELEDILKSPKRRSLSSDDVRENECGAERDFITDCFEYQEKNENIDNYSECEITLKRDSDSEERDVHRDPLTTFSLQRETEEAKGRLELFPTRLDQERDEGMTGNTTGRTSTPSYDKKTHGDGEDMDDYVSLPSHTSVADDVWNVGEVVVSPVDKGRTENEQDVVGQLDVKGPPAAAHTDIVTREDVEYSTVSTEGLTERIHEDPYNGSHTSQVSKGEKDTQDSSDLPLDQQSSTAVSEEFHTIDKTPKNDLVDPGCTSMGLQMKVVPEDSDFPLERSPEVPQTCEVYGTENNFDATKESTLLQQQHDECRSSIVVLNEDRQSEDHPREASFVSTESEVTWADKNTENTQHSAIFFSCGTETENALDGESAVYDHTNQTEESGEVTTSVAVLQDQKSTDKNGDLVDPSNALYQQTMTEKCESMGNADCMTIQDKIARQLGCYAPGPDDTPAANVDFIAVNTLSTLQLKTHDEQSNLGVDLVDALEGDKSTTKRERQTEYVQLQVKDDQIAPALTYSENTEVSGDKITAFIYQKELEETVDPEDVAIMLCQDRTTEEYGVCLRDFAHMPCQVSEIKVNRDSGIFERTPSQERIMMDESINVDYVTPMIVEKTRAEEDNANLLNSPIMLGQCTMGVESGGLEDSGIMLSQDGYSEENGWNIKQKDIVCKSVNDCDSLLRKFSETSEESTEFGLNPTSESTVGTMHEHDKSNYLSNFDSKTNTIGDKKYVDSAAEDNGNAILKCEESGNSLIISGQGRENEGHTENLQNEVLSYSQEQLQAKCAHVIDLGIPVETRQTNEKRENTEYTCDTVNGAELSEKHVEDIDDAIIRKRSEDEESGCVTCTHKIAGQGEEMEFSDDTVAAIDTFYNTEKTEDVNDMEDYYMDGKVKDRQEENEQWIDRNEEMAADSSGLIRNISVGSNASKQTEENSNLEDVSDDQKKDFSTPRSEHEYLTKDSGGVEDVEGLLSDDQQTEYCLGSNNNTSLLNLEPQRKEIHGHVNETSITKESENATDFGEDGCMFNLERQTEVHTTDSYDPVMPFGSTEKESKIADKDITEELVATAAIYDQNVEDNAQSEPLGSLFMPERQLNQKDEDIEHDGNMSVTGRLKEMDLKEDEVCYDELIQGSKTGKDIDKLTDDYPVASTDDDGKQRECSESGEFAVVVDPNNEVHKDNSEDPFEDQSVKQLKQFSLEYDDLGLITPGTSLPYMGENEETSEISLNDAIGLNERDVERETGFTILKGQKEQINVEIADMRGHDNVLSEDPGNSGGSLLQVKQADPEFSYSGDSVDVSESDGCTEYRGDMSADLLSHERQIEWGEDTTGSPPVVTNRDIERGVKMDYVTGIDESEKTKCECGEDTSPAIKKIMETDKDDVGLEAAPVPFDETGLSGELCGEYNNYSDTFILVGEAAESNNGSMSFNECQHSTGAVGRDNGVDLTSHVDERISASSTMINSANQVEDETRDVRLPGDMSSIANLGEDNNMMSEEIAATVMKNIQTAKEGSHSKTILIKDTWIEICDTEHTDPTFMLSQETQEERDDERGPDSLLADRREVDTECENSSTSVTSLDRDIDTKDGYEHVVDAVAVQNQNQQIIDENGVYRVPNVNTAQGVGKEGKETSGELYDVASGKQRDSTSLELHTVISPHLEIEQYATQVTSSAMVDAIWTLVNGNTQTEKLFGITDGFSASTPTRTQFNEICEKTFDDVSQPRHTEMTAENLEDTGTASLPREEIEETAILEQDDVTNLRSTSLQNRFQDDNNDSFELDIKPVETFVLHRSDVSDCGHTAETVYDKSGVQSSKGGLDRVSSFNETSTPVLKGDPLSEFVTNNTVELETIKSSLMCESTCVELPMDEEKTRLEECEQSRTKSVTLDATALSSDDDSFKDVEEGEMEEVKGLPQGIKSVKEQDDEFEECMDYSPHEESPIICMPMQDIGEVKEVPNSDSSLMVADNEMDVELSENPICEAVQSQGLVSEAIERRGSRTVTELIEDGVHEGDAKSYEEIGHETNLSGATAQQLDTSCQEQGVEKEELTDLNEENDNFQRNPSFQEENASTSSSTDNRMTQSCFIS